MVTKQALDNKYILPDYKQPTPVSGEFIIQGVLSPNDVILRFNQ